MSRTAQIYACEECAVLVVAASSLLVYVRRNNRSPMKSKKRYEITLSNRTHTTEDAWYADWRWVARVKANWRWLINFGEHDVQIRDRVTGHFVRE